MKDRLEELEIDFELRAENVRSECLEEMRCERELELEKRIRSKLTKQIEKELNESLPAEIE